MRPPILPAFLLLLLPLPAAAQTMALDYLCRYQCQLGPDHLMGAAALSGNRALVVSNQGLTLVDLAALTPGGTRTYLDRLAGIDGRDLVLTAGEGHVFVNAKRGHRGGHSGFDVIRISGNKLTWVTSVSETGILYEKMVLAGNLLYVAAHRHGLRIYDVTDPAKPVLAGKLEQGFVDAWAPAVAGARAYVADGAGGLKIVDVSQPAAPRMIAGEDPAAARGTYLDVALDPGRVYVAAGSRGLAVYPAGSLQGRTFHPLPGCAESLCWSGDHLVVGALGAVAVFRPGTGTEAALVAWEKAHRRGAGAVLRFSEDVAAASAGRILVANWNWLDVYELKDRVRSTQPDIVCSRQRFRFPPAGGTDQATLTNRGGAALKITSVVSTSAAVRAGYTGSTLAPGASVTFDITCQGGPGAVEGLIKLASNDPDEGIFPIQVYGGTSYLDPGEKAPDFTAQTLVRDPRTGAAVAGPPFTLSQHRGKVIWFSIFASW